MKILAIKLPEEEKSNVEKAIADLKTALEAEDLDAVKEKTESLMQASMKIGEMAYRKAQEENAGEEDMDTPEGDASANAEPINDDVLDADFTDLEVEDEESSEEKSA